jgi:hypothetical protein
MLSSFSFGEKIVHEIIIDFSYLPSENKTDENPAIFNPLVGWMQHERN